MKPNDTDLLIQLLAKQIKRAHSLDGVWGTEALQARKAACDAANSTIDMLEHLGTDPEEAIWKADRINNPVIWSFNNSILA